MENFLITCANFLDKNYVSCLCEASKGHAKLWTEKNHSVKCYLSVKTFFLLSFLISSLLFYFILTFSVNYLFVAVKCFYKNLIDLLEV